MATEQTAGDGAHALDLGGIDLAAPQEHYRVLLREGVVAPEGAPITAATREAVDTVLRHHEVFSSEYGHVELGNIRPLIPVSVDPPAHVKYRRLLDPLFAPKRMDAIESDVAARANHFIDTFIDRGECNFSDEYAELFPSSVFLGLMGLPWEELHTLLRLRDGILRPYLFDPEATFNTVSPAEVARATALEIYDFFGAILDERTRHPAEDILSHFLSVEVEGERLSREEILDICFLFLIAGLDTVSDSLTCFFAYLAQHPKHRAELVEDPSRIPGAVEELLRWETPVSAVQRVAKVDFEVAGRTIPAGSRVSASVGAANLDPAVFPEPFEVDFGRPANPHLAFGGGVHRCLGSHLARRELRVTLREWHRRIPEYWLKPGHETLEYQPGMRHVKDLILAWPK